MFSTLQKTATNFVTCFCSCRFSSFFPFDLLILYNINFSDMLQLFWEETNLSHATWMFDLRVRKTIVTKWQTNGSQLDLEDVWKTFVMNFNLNFRGRGEILLFQYILALPKSWKLKYWRNIQHVERTAFHLFRGFNFARTPKKHVICAVFTKELSPRSQVSTEIRLSQKQLCDNLIAHMFQFSRKMWRGP